MTNNGMDLRGTRPVKDDPDVLLKLSPGQWYGWPDFSADLNPIAESRYQPPQEMILARGYPENSFLIDHVGSGLSNPSPFKDQLLFGMFPALSGAAKMDFVPSSGPFKEYRGSAIIALGGDRSPFATANRKLKAPVGFKVMRVDPDDRQAREFIRNTDGVPASMIKPRVEALERPVDVKFGPDGKLYILDFGRMEVRGGKESVTAGSGRVFVLEPVTDPVPPATSTARR
jgi:glucose/arabinose dehydrogenase